MILYFINPIGSLFTKRITSIIVLVFLCSFTLNSFAQISSGRSTGAQMNINQLSDQQIIQIWQQSQRQGMSESDAINGLVKQGLSPNEVNSFKKEIGSDSKWT